ncbi:BTB/POZ domain-containing protein At3g19850-like [Salvia miltiorrhiza]|uniref:BTB/POZ domain-containing protein At3g19850-like n=1 Tax=Salvia miltiorrhiza TaxID=226208 RepID=UPI0025ABF028|nr:BTB/POZ domain-containing protein At3g19850-like [Salvia miltiorrhiza]
MLDQAKLDDLLVFGGGGDGGGGGVYDVNLVVRLVRLFVYDNMSMERMVKVGFLIDMYLGEIGPDPTLRFTKFLVVAESLPDCARDSFDQVYRAIDIYLQILNRLLAMRSWYQATKKRNTVKVSMKIRQSERFRNLAAPVKMGGSKDQSIEHELVKHKTIRMG